MPASPKKDKSSQVEHLFFQVNRQVSANHTAVGGDIKVDNPITINLCAETATVITQDRKEVKITPNDFNSIRSKLQESLKQCYGQYTKLPRLFDDTKVNISESFINLSLLINQDVIAKENKLKINDERLDSYEELYASHQSIELTRLFQLEIKSKQPAKYIAIYGRAGIGKTVLCQYIATQWANENKQLFRDNFEAVFWIKLRTLANDYNQENMGKFKTQEDFLCHMLDKCCLVGSSQQKPTLTELAAYLEKYKNKVLFLLDGYDEIVDRLHTTHWHLKDVLTAFRTYGYILITSRPMSIQQLGMHDITFNAELECMGFTNDNISTYIKRFMEDCNKSQEVDSLMQFLHQHPSIWGTAHIPINLELICWGWTQGIFKNVKQETITLTGLYSEIIQRLREYNSEKHQSLLNLRGCYLNSNKTITLAELAYRFLRELAYKALQQQQLLLPPSLIRGDKITHRTGILQRFVQRYQQKLKDSASLTPIEVLTAATQLGLLKSTGEGGKDLLDQTHYFIHLSFQEYLAADYYKQQFLKLQPKQMNDIVQQVRNDKYKPYYQLTWRFTAGLLYQNEKDNKPYNGLENFFNVLLDEPRDLIGNYHLSLLAYCLDECLADVTIPFIKNLVEQQSACLIRLLAQDNFSKWKRALQRCPNLLLSKDFQTILINNSCSQSINLLLTLPCLSQENLQTITTYLVSENNQSVANFVARKLSQHPNMDKDKLKKLLDSNLSDKIKTSINEALQLNHNIASNQNTSQTYKKIANEHLSPSKSYNIRTLFDIVATNKIKDLGFRTNCIGLLCLHPNLEKKDIRELLDLVQKPSFPHWLKGLIGLHLTKRTDLEIDHIESMIAFIKNQKHSNMAILDMVCRLMSLCKQIGQIEQLFSFIKRSEVELKTKCSIAKGLVRNTYINNTNYIQQIIENDTTDFEVKQSLFNELRFVQNPLFKQRDTVPSTQNSNELLIKVVWTFVKNNKTNFNVQSASILLALWFERSPKSFQKAIELPYSDILLFFAECQLQEDWLIKVTKQALYFNELEIPCQISINRFEKLFIGKLNKYNFPKETINNHTDRRNIGFYKYINNMILPISNGKIEEHKDESEKSAFDGKNDKNSHLCNLS